MLNLRRFTHRAKAKPNGGSKVKKAKMISAALIIMLSTVIFGMSGDGGNVPVVPKKEAVKATTQENVPVEQKEVSQTNANVTVKDQFGIDTGMSKEEFEKFKKEYYDYAQKNNITTGIFTDQAYFLKINLLNNKLFAKDYNIYLSNPMDACSLNDFIIRSELIVIGKYVDFTLDSDKNSKFPVTYQFIVDKIVANETEYNTIPEYIKIKELSLGAADFEKLAVRSNDIVKKGEQYILFLSRLNFYYYNDSYKAGRIKESVKDDCFLPYTFTNLGYSTRIIKNNKIRISYEKSVLDQDNWLSIDDLKKSAKEIFEINNRKDFYKRSYK